MNNSEIRKKREARGSNQADRNSPRRDFQSC